MGVHFDIPRQDEDDEENSEESGGDDNKIRDLIVGDLLRDENSDDAEDMKVRDLLGDARMLPNVEP